MRATNKLGSAAVVTAKPRFRLQTLSSLKYRDFRLLWMGSFFSSAGQWIQQTTLSWLTYQLTGSPFLLGAVNGFRSLPMLALGPLGGVAADRMDRKRLMLTTQIAIAVVAALFATIIVTGQLQTWHLFAFTGLMGVAFAFNMPVRQSVIPSLIPREEVMNGVALNSAAMNSTRIVGPAIAGLLIAAVGAGENFYIQAVAYLLVAFMVGRMTIPPLQGTMRRISVRGNLAEGLHYIWRHPTLRTQMSLALIMPITIMPYMSLVPIFAKDILKVGPSGYGFIMSAGGVGALLGALVLASLGNVKHKGLILLATLFIGSIAVIIYSQSRSFPLTLGLQVVMSGSFMVFMAVNQTLLQLSTSDEMLGRVMGAYTLNQGLTPLGSLLMGGMAQVLGAPNTLMIMGVVACIYTVLFAIGSTSLREL